MQSLGHKIWLQQVSKTAEFQIVDLISEEVKMIREILQTFAGEIAEKYKTGLGHNEANLTHEIVSLVNSTGKSLGLQIQTRAQIELRDQKLRPDLGVFSNRLLCGYIEIKAPGTGAVPSKFSTKHNKEQWQKLKALPNLIYTDGIEWGLYRYGKSVEGHKVIRFSPDINSFGNSSVNDSNSASFERLFADFLTWDPDVPKDDPSKLAEFLAPFAKYLRDEVTISLKQSDSAIAKLADEWRDYFFPDADNMQFADAYAQTVTYALLLAKLAGATDLSPIIAAETLGEKNGLLAQTLRIHGQEEAKSEVSVGYSLIQRILNEIDPVALNKSKPDLWIYFYEDFLEKYNPTMKKQFGAYYTPKEVVRAQINLAGELMESEFNKNLGFADSGVKFIDPAVGTGTYLVEAIEHGLKKTVDNQGIGQKPAKAKQIADNMFGFEILVGPYAVAHLRLTQIIENAINDGRKDSLFQERLGNRLNIYLADTLEDPESELTRSSKLPLFYNKLGKENEEARKIKNTGNILVCIGNPPYNRQEIEAGDDQTQRKGGWIRSGGHEYSQNESDGTGPLLNKFLKDDQKNMGIHAQSLFNDYVYFWRWALWRIYENQEKGGIVSFITPSSFLKGPGFEVMRKVMRQTFDKIWIIDVGGNNRGSRKSPNVFPNVRTPVAITIGVRGDKESPSVPAKVKYAKIEANSRGKKLQLLNSIKSFSCIEWENCSDDWYDVFLPTKTGYFVEFHDWPVLTDIFPWQHSGAQFKRTWPIAETVDLLKKRWEKFCNSDQEERKKQFKTTRDRSIDKEYVDFNGEKQLPLYKLNSDSPIPRILRYGYRFLDRRYALFDTRFGDYLRPQLVQVFGENNIFFASPTSDLLDEGPALVATREFPDLDFLHKGGGAEIFPLYRDKECNVPNLNMNVLSKLGDTFGVDVTPKDFANYVYGILGGSYYVKKFWEELEIMKTRVPITKDKKLFQEMLELGVKLLDIHTKGWQSIKKGKATPIDPIPFNSKKYPNSCDYDRKNQNLHIGEGMIGGVQNKVWNYKLNNTRIVESWIKYRLKDRKGKKNSPLDDDRPDSWSAEMTDELLKLLWIIEGSLKIESDLEKKFNEVLSTPCFLAADFPQVDKNLIDPPKKSFTSLQQYELDI